MRALITGAAGFIGANLTRALAARGFDVWAVYRPGSDAWRLEGLPDTVRIEALDIGDDAGFRRLAFSIRPTWLFHLAAYGAYPSQRDRRRIIETNLLGTASILTASAEAGVGAVIHTGSSSEYGIKDHAPSEAEPVDPNSDYAVAKVAATMLCRQFARETGLRAVTARLYSAYGPWEEPGRLMPALVMNALHGHLPPLADPEISRDFVYVDDVCDALVVLAESGRAGQIYNVCTGRRTTLADLVDISERLFHTEARPAWGSMERRSWDTSVWVGNPAKLRDELGWSARVTLEAGLRRMADWLRSAEAPAQRYARSPLAGHSSDPQRQSKPT